jgi:hypothetical protein
MSTFVEGLETRTLFAANPAITADLLRIVGDGQAIATDVRQSLPTLLADARAISSDLHALPNSVQNQPLVKKLRLDQQSWISTLRADGAAAAHAGSAKARLAIADGIRVFLHPTNLTFIARLGADLLSLGSAVAGPLSTLQSQAASGQAAILADLSNLAAANPTDATLQSHVQQVQTDASNAANTITQAGQNLQTDLGTLVTDLTGL